MLVQPIDRRQTKKLVEENLKIYNRYLLSIADNNQLLINENTFEIRLDVNSENISEKEREKLQFIQYVITRYNRLCILDKNYIFNLHDKRKTMTDLLLII